MHSYNIQDNIVHVYFNSEPFNKREAWNWLKEQISFSNEAYKVYTTIRSLAYLWKWHRSKVERFIKALKNEELIYVEIRSGKTVISLVKRMISGEVTSSGKTKPIQNRDKLGDRHSRAITQDKRSICQSDNLQKKTASRQSQDSLAFSGRELQKKEKNQKKESFEVYSIKEKTSPYGRVKKERYKSLQEILEQVSVDAVSEFATGLGIEPMQLEWELGKFKDHWLSNCNRLPKNSVAAFRNWLRKSIEFREGRKNYEQFGKTKSTQTRFEQFLSAGARAVAKFERDRLDRKTDWIESGLLSEDSCDSQWFTNLSPVN